MQDETMKKAIDNFIGQRIDDCGMGENEGLQETYQQFEQALKTLKSTLTPKQEKVFIGFENAYSVVDGETTNCYYHAGFSDAIEFLLGWREIKWN